MQFEYAGYKWVTLKIYNCRPIYNRKRHNKNHYCLLFDKKEKESA